MSRAFLLRESAGYLVNRLAASMSTALERELQPFDVTAQQWALMATLAELDEARVVAVAERLGVDVGAASRLIDRLEKKRLVSRKRTRADARAASVQLTPGGRALVPRLAAGAERVLDRFLGVLAPRERTQLVGLLSRLVDAAGEASAR